jgi:UDP-N-acetylmuramate dehydrogenase
MAAIAGELRRRGITGRVTAEAPLRDLTTYRIGGPAEALVEPAREDDVEIVLDFVREEGAALYVIGGGSKVLDLMGEIRAAGDEMEALAGAPNALLAGKAAGEGWPGLEWIYDIPGRVGGSLVQNAGMNECSISDHLVEVRLFRGFGPAAAVGKEELEFGYRSSSFKTWGDAVIVSAKFRFEEREDAGVIRGRMEEIRKERHGKFPVEMPTCGSVFKRPPGGYPGRLIEECGLGGTSAGGAAISTMHHNFIVNMGGAGAADVRNLVDLIERTVLERNGVKLERELIYMEEILFPCKSRT